MCVQDVVHFTELTDCTSRTVYTDENERKRSKKLNKNGSNLLGHSVKHQKMEYISPHQIDFTRAEIILIHKSNNDSLLCVFFRLLIGSDGEWAGGR